uniref:Cleavage and polyadenylation specificity factor subunit 1 n=1 Tax=Mandrillus leucophaeus TaxID=9568 RepID=A0A2K6AD29_MANLE
MYAVYKQAHPPTGLEFAMYCNFFNNSERNLVVAGTSQLYVYRLNRDAEALTKNDRSAEGKAHREKLELAASFSFFGNVMSMASVQLAGAKRDALLLSFKDAKLSVVEYDPGTHDLKTLSLHYFEEPELRDGFVQNVHTPRVRVDPDGRCAAMLVYGTRLVVLPFRRESLAEEHEGLVGEGQRSSFLPSYIIDVRALDEKLLNIIDLQFLHGYYEPTLLILFEPNQTWPGRVAVRQDTCSIVAISLNITQKVHPVIWSLTSLPFDCTQALAVPKPIGGVVVFAVNSLLYLNQSVPPYGVALNSLTTGTTAFPLRTQEGVRITLDCAQATFISYDKMRPPVPAPCPPLSPPLSPQQSKVITLCLYRDLSGMFTTESRLGGARDELGGRIGSEAEGLGSETSPTVDDEEEMLYGDSGSLFSPSKEEARRSSQPPADRDPAPFRAEPTHWCLLVRENGTMEIYQLPDWRLVFLVKNFPVGQRVLVDSSFGQPTTQGEARREEATRQGELPLVKEVLLVALGSRQSRPYLLPCPYPQPTSSHGPSHLPMVHVDQELLIYEAFPHDSQLGQGNLKVRFKKVPHNINFREKKPKPSKKKAEGGGTEEGAGARGRVARFRYFEDIYGYSGVFICGPSPHWLLVTGRGALRLHPMAIDGPVDSFAPFHNVNCPRGFLYFNRQGELRISVLPAYLSYDAPWPVRKIPLRCTAHYVAYHVESKVYAVATSTNTPCARIPRMTGEEKEFETIERDERYIHPQQEAFSIQLISPVSWEAIPNARIELQEWEHVTCMKTVSLRSEETVSGLKGYVAAGTCLMQGEEVTCRGRILIMDVIEVVPEPGQPLTKNKFKVLYEKEQKGPVTALCHCNGHLVSAIGQKIFLWSLRASELTGMAFIDTQLYIHQMISVKNFILAADVMKSISLLRYQEESKTLSLVSRVRLWVFWVCGQVSDRDRNLMVYMYLPEAKESFGGMRLLRRADFHVGAHVNTFWRTPCRGATEGLSKKSVVWENKHITWFATLDGGIGLLLPMQEKTYRRLLMLQNALTTMLPHHAGLNPRAFRMLHVDRRTLQNAVRNVLDGELLNRYLYLSTMERSELAKKIGTTPDIILDDLLETDRVTAHF